MNKITLSAESFRNECDALLRVVNVHFFACVDNNERSKCREVAARRHEELSRTVPKRSTAELCDLKLRALAAFVARFG